MPHSAVVVTQNLDDRGTIVPMIFFMTSDGVSEQVMENSPPAPKGLVRDLRGRRRLETINEVRDVALDLFEKKGVDSVTVADISTAAGVGRRTFFRMFETKESAIFAENPDYVNVLEEWAGKKKKLDHAYQSLLDTLERATGFMDYPVSRRRELRIFRLRRVEPKLEIGLVRAKAAHGDRVRRALARRASDEYSKLEIMTLAMIANALVDASVEEWLTRRDAGQEARLQDIFVEARKIASAA